MATGFSLPSFHYVFSIVCTIVILTSKVACGGYNTTFEWFPSVWSSCVHKEAGSCCDCYRTRDIACVYSATRQVVPPFYCHKSGKSKPPEKHPCTPCQQNCVMTSWGQWSACSDTCTPGTKFRTRNVILPPQDGGATCGPLVELKDCDDPSLPLCVFTDLNPQYEWTVGGWSSCRKFSNDSLCGDGIRDRIVSCQDVNRHEVSINYCRYYFQGAEPVSDQLCHIPCDCEVTTWSDWGPCSMTCHKGSSSTGYHGYQVRTRSMTREPEEGGATCPELMDTKPCDTTTIPTCPRYIWHKSEWGECALTDRTDGTELCGPGVQTRDVYCTLDGNPYQQPVADILCVQDVVNWDNDSSPIKPPERRACQVLCPQDCTLGEWENWSSCTQSCGTGGIRIRTRPIVQEHTKGGEECEITGRYEEKACDPVACTWWHKGQWSACSMESLFGKQCGMASQERSVYCLNSLDEVLEDEHCREDGAKPEASQDCWIPCPGQCVVSDWSEWGDCSASCGIKGGLQSRTRQILDPGSDPSSPCPLEDDLEQTRPCNQIPCKVHLWQVTGWSDCQRKDNQTRECGPGTNSGIQTRELICQMDPGYPLSADLCNPDDKPITSRSCAAPCPQNCKLSAWGDWSKCGQTCGSNNLKVKVRFVLRWPRYDGKQCPGKPDEDGVIMKKKSCTRRPQQCSAVEWKTSDWGVCEVKVRHQGPPCGKGIQTRNVTCVKESSREVNNGMCYEQGLGVQPSNARICHITCPGDCRLSDWSEYSPCSQTCGQTPGMRTRNRYILKWDRSRPLEEQCPELKDVALVDNIPCSTTPCPTYHWVMGDWGSCIPQSDEDSPSPTCGKGIRTRHVLCVQENGAYVPDHRCDIVSAMPRRQQACNVPCTYNCEVSSWSNWSNCSQPCGSGLQHRQRRIFHEMENGGRKCPELLDVNMCFVRDCQDLDWLVGTWGVCQPNWGMHCGAGIQTRNVTCPVGPEHENLCDERLRKPMTQTECFVPCMGDCIMSEWTEFGPCDCKLSNPVRTRSRAILQEALSSATQCGRTTEDEPCPCPTYKLVIGGWTNCEVFKVNNKHRDCGRGIQRRPVNCMDAGGKIVHLSNCVLGNLTFSQSCEVACPRDCEVTEYTPWSPCSAECGVTAMKSRSVSIINVGNTLGSSCPEADQLQQIQVCNSVPCYNYTWSRGPWHGCEHQETGQCGMSRETRVVQCYRSDGAAVQDLYCLMQDEYPITLLDDLTQKEAAELDLDTERSCGTPCPGDCVLTDWSEYGPCLQNCSRGSNLGIQARSRAVISPAMGGSPCPWELIQSRSCPLDDAVCPMFAWESGTWNNRDKRKVQCMLNGLLVVNGGCILEEQPSRYMDCGDTCGEFAECIEGICSCEPGFLGDGIHCLPEFGCANDNHCFLNNTYCDLMNKECLCYDETLPGIDLLCNTRASAYGDDPLDELNQLFIYILIGCLIALLLLGIVTIACMISHRNKRGKRSPGVSTATKLTKIDNLDTMPKNNDRQRPEPVYNKKLTSANQRDDKNLARSYQNAPYTQPYHPNLTRASSEHDTGKGDSASSGNNSPPRNFDHLDLDLDEDLFLDQDAASQPFLPREESPRRLGAPVILDERPTNSAYDTNSLPSPKKSPLHPDAVVRVPSSRSMQPVVGSDSGSCLSTFRPDDSYTLSTPSTDSDLTTIWIPHQNNLSGPQKQHLNRFPVNQTPPNTNQRPQKIDSESAPQNRNRPSTPPDMYENLSSRESSPGTQPPLPPPRTPKGPPPPIAPKPSAKVINDAMQSYPEGRPINRRHNTEPVPAQYRNGMVFPRGDAVAPSEESLTPQTGMKEDPRDLKDTRGVSEGNMSAQTRDLLQYCDELLADLQRVANS